ncbi:thiamine phosphate synthase [Rhizobium leguminosarum]|uniref:thiamine phosphate synthase n=1 Tax=Rhizobium leguminosarum TaxID=384 RepID=UPI00103E3D6C|nr:thiamine phosphate synthase [Rhizobium leguminosarum]MBY5344372.1 thiamine phosphate synthase [Rhizobium leguminosarum]MBY5392440.1 thiamine phosphate synthase [Rhizobium leguminosarum]MBY5434581.1 thiamine phosphate synthase [Rhizobium leguminosarum]NEK46197.1 thiamine phosphate synthase [Rhizobium leguminosarum]NKK53576.1 thiamine phosphate synthase [Rhizobium leguminosarum bv. viciae]
MKLDPFYLIVDSTEWIARLVPLGVKLVQLRIKDRPETELRAEIRRAVAVCAKHQSQLVVNDHWRLAIEEGCGFVHLGQEDLATADLDAIRASGLKLGLSTHDERELETALAARPDYIALGPVYTTILKQMKWAPQGLTRLSEWKSRIGDPPLVAIGGLNVERIEDALAHGADSVAVVTDIMRHENPELRTKQWIVATAQARIHNLQ